MATVHQPKTVTRPQLDRIVTRLYTTGTESSRCEAGTPYVARDVISPRGKGPEDVDEITQRLATTWTASSSGTYGTRAAASDTISRQPVSARQLDNIVRYLNTTYTEASRDRGGAAEVARRPSVDVCRPPISAAEVEAVVVRLHTTHTASSLGDSRGRRVCFNSIARKPATDNEIQDIVQRLVTTHTKSSAGGVECREAPVMKTPGYGLKAYPVIDGIETRFAGFMAPPDKVDEVITRLRKTQTKASQARLDNHQILLYPERTLLMNDPERIRTYQSSGAIAKQTVLQRREKWFN